MTSIDLLIMFGPLLVLSIFMAFAFGVYSYISFRKGFD
jgi:hypothetical protein